MLVELINRFLSAYGSRELTDLQENFALFFSNFLDEFDLERIRHVPLDPADEVTGHLEKRLRLAEQVGPGFTTYPQALSVFENNRRSIGLPDEYVEELCAAMGTRVHGMFSQWITAELKKHGGQLLQLLPDPIADHLTQKLDSIPGIQETLRHEELALQVFSWPTDPPAVDDPVHSIFSALDAHRSDLENRFAISGDTARAIIDSLKHFVLLLVERFPSQYSVKALFATKLPNGRTEGSIRQLGVLGLRGPGGTGTILPTFRPRDGSTTRALEQAHGAALAYLYRHCAEQWNVAQDCNVYVSIESRRANFEGSSIGLPVALAIVAWALEVPIGVKSPGDVAATGAFQEVDGSADYAIVPVGDIPAKVNAVLQWNKGEPGSPIRLVLVPSDNKRAAQGAYCEKAEAAPNVAIVGVERLEQAFLAK